MSRRTRGDIKRHREQWKEVDWEDEFEEKEKQAKLEDFDLKFNRWFG